MSGVETRRSFFCSRRSEHAGGPSAPLSRSQQREEQTRFPAGPCPLDRSQSFCPGAVSRIFSGRRQLSRRQHCIPAGIQRNFGLITRPQQPRFGLLRREAWQRIERLRVVFFGHVSDTRKIIHSEMNRKGRPALFCSGRSGHTGGLCAPSRGATNMKNQLAFLLVPAVIVGLTPAAWGQKSPPAPAGTPQTPGSTGASSTTDRTSSGTSSSDPGATSPDSGRNNKGTSNSRRNATSHRSPASNSSGAGAGRSSTDSGSTRSGK